MLLVKRSIMSNCWVTTRKADLHAGSRSNRLRFSTASRRGRQRFAADVTNGAKMIAGVDGRSAEARRYRDLAMSFADDCGGAASLTEAQRALVAQAAALTVQSETPAGRDDSRRGCRRRATDPASPTAWRGRSLGLASASASDRKLSVPEYLAQRDARRAAKVAETPAKPRSRGRRARASRRRPMRARG